MPTGFAAIPAAVAYRLHNVALPLCLAATGGLAGDAHGLTRADITVAEGRIASVLPAGTATPDDDLPAVDCDGGIALPRFVDIHTHLDKGHIWPRRPNPDGTFMGALDSVALDREAHWTAEDVFARMDFGLRAAFAHGTGALRTHLDSVGKQTAISWPVFTALREAWAGRITLQATALFPVDLAVDDEPQFRSIVATVARHGGVLGGVTFLGATPDDRLRLALERIVDAAAARGLDLDLHVDESDAPEARSLEVIADTVLRLGFAGKVLVGHCCSLALQAEEEARRVSDKLAAAGIAVVSLPMCNMYLQDRRVGADGLTRATPRWRGVAPLHELKAAGVPVMVASDNTRDPFYAYGDLDMIEVLREATRILHLDHAGDGWVRTVTATPAEMMRLDGTGRIVAGGAADLVLTRARSWTELFARPQGDRTVLVAGRPVDTTPPDYRELDGLMHATPRT
ncbi:cytosine deaminase [Chelatococcus sp. SYSU_G07232]|uniref:Cytosine deaminase n=1 Tax=Chelatococcus albus TaxID=3047466 RepID=A0ABT7AG81_9HYPH|nr:cytosine deaminase [Chelatococcus sp. SYSU_G07232]MDJ1158367.1 cytosine deaminase [Chelatococcus sp. SYSU_G07232]